MTALIITLRAVIEMFGSLIFGFLFDHYHHGLLIGLTSLMAAITMQGLAFIDSIQVAWTFAAFNGFAVGVMSVGRYTSVPLTSTLHTKN